MRCLVCGKKIGPFRRMLDRKYCCDRHRRTAQKLSARAVRDAQDFDELEEPWLVAPILHDQKRQSPGGGLGPASGILVIVLIIFVVLVAPPSRSPAPVTRVRPRSFSLLEKIQKMIPGAPSFDIRDDFQADLSDWVGDLGDLKDWTSYGGKIKLGHLRLWKPTLNLANYQMVFQAQIESNAMGWAFRAKDLDNYYAAKIAIPGASGPSRPEIVRYVVVAGKKTQRIRLPLPMTIHANVPYKVRVRVKNNHFSTTINGQVVDTWTDSRYKKGGVGFFSEPGDRALVSWVRVTDGEGIFERLLSFSLLVGPPELFAPGPPGF